MHRDAFLQYAALAQDLARKRAGLPRTGPLPHLNCHPQGQEDGVACQSCHLTAFELHQDQAELRLGQMLHVTLPGLVYNCSTSCTAGGTTDRLWYTAHDLATYIKNWISFKQEICMRKHRW